MVVNLLLIQPKRCCAQAAGGTGKRAFCATGFEKRTAEAAVWMFLHCASTSLV
jgi:hypothetical protein